MEIIKEFRILICKIPPGVVKKPSHYNQYIFLKSISYLLSLATSLVGILEMRRIQIEKFLRNFLEISIQLCIVFELKSHVTLAFLFVIHPGNTTQEKQKQGYFA